MKAIIKERFKFIWEQRNLFLPYWDKLLIVNLSSTIGTVFSMVLPLFSKLLLDYAYPNRSLRLLNIAIVGGVVVGGIQAFSRHITSYLNMYLNQRITSRLQRKIFKMILSTPLSFHNRKNLGERNMLLQRDTGVIPSLICGTIPGVFQALVSLGIAVYVVTKLDIGLTFFVLATVPLYFLSSRFFAYYQRELREDTRSKSRELFNHIFEKFNFVKTVKSFGKEERETNRYSSLLEDQISLERENFFCKRLSGSIKSSFMKIMSILVVYYAGYRVIKGELSIGDITVLSMYLMKLYSPFMNFAGIYQSIVPTTLSIDRLIKLTRHKKDEDYGNVQLREVKGAISIRGVSFKYENEEILKDINLDIPLNTITAVCGESGIGKTTLVDLIARFYVPNKGKIFIDNIDIMNIKLRDLRKHIALVPQEYILFQGSIRDNILYGNENASYEDFQNAVKLARIDSFVEKFPDSYDTIIGGKKGINLSAGERQRIAIARAVICNPKILILDEVTSALDPDTEYNICSSLKEFCKKRTVIIIAHRISTIIDADKIVMLDNKAIREEGSFNELIAKEGLFYHYYQIQYHERHKDVFTRAN